MSSKNTLRILNLQRIEKSTVSFVLGKGGVGRTSISRALAASFAKKGENTAWVTLEHLSSISPLSNLTHININGFDAFQEYMKRLINLGPLTKPLIGSNFLRYLVEIAPGFKELIMIGKIWDLTKHHDRVIVDMPSTGYALVMFQAIFNFNKLFRGGKVHRHTELMIDYFSDPDLTKFLIVSLPEETPLRESLELSEKVQKLFPNNAPLFLINKKFPDANLNLQLEGAVPHTISEYISARNKREKESLAIWNKQNITYSEVPFISPKKDLVLVLSEQLMEQTLL